MPKAMRTCGTCGTLVHVRKNPCDCGHVFPKKGDVVPTQTTKTTKVVSTPKRTETTQVAPTATSPANSYSDAHVRLIKELQNHIGDLEKAMEKREKVWEAKLARIETQYKKFYSHQAYLLHQRAWEKVGGKGDLYHSKEFGDDPKMFKEQSDETGVFIPPALPDHSSEYPDGPATDEMIEKAAEVMITDREPVERDLKGDGVIIDDVMSFSYAVPVEQGELSETPTFDALDAMSEAREHVNFLIGGNAK